MTFEFDRISVIGLGYIGLPTAAAFAARKVQVVGVDVNQVAVDTINEGRIHIVEPELDMIVHAAVTDGYLRASTKPEPCDAYLIAVPTPFKGNHEPDLSYIQQVADTIAPVLKKGDLVVLESTSPIGTTEKLCGWLAAHRPDLSFPTNDAENADILVAYCPERVLPGRVMHELIENDRIIGGMSPKSAEAAVALYGIFLQGDCHITDARTAELCKLTENASRDVSIAFANELSLICDEHAINVWELIKLANYHPRVNILQPGPGVGGHCIAVDPWFIVSSSPERTRLIQAARHVNDNKPDWVVEKVLHSVSEFQSQHGDDRVKIACLGLSFKPDIDDLRESPAVEIAVRLADEESVELIAVEPNIESLPRVLEDRGVRLLSLENAIELADVILILVDHKNFRANARAISRHGTVIDTKGLVWSNESDVNGLMPPMKRSGLIEKAAKTKF